jgi:hypothetical protein
MKYTYKRFMFYAKSDLVKEPIGKVLAYDYEGALFYFTFRKKMDHNKFLEMYNIEENGTK